MMQEKPVGTLRQHVSAAWQALKSWAGGETFRSDVTIEHAALQEGWYHFA